MRNWVYSLELAGAYNWRDGRGEVDEMCGMICEEGEVINRFKTLSMEYVSSMHLIFPLLMTCHVTSCLFLFFQNKSKL